MQDIWDFITRVLYFFWFILPYETIHPQRAHACSSFLYFRSHIYLSRYHECRLRSIKWGDIWHSPERDTRFWWLVQPMRWDCEKCGEPRGCTGEFLCTAQAMTVMRTEYMYLCDSSRRYDPVPIVLSFILIYETLSFSPSHHSPIREYRSIRRWCETFSGYRERYATHPSRIGHTDWYTSLHHRKE